MYSETVREPQLVITTPDPCGHYEATVTPMCGSIAGAQTNPIKLGGMFIGKTLFYVQEHAKFENNVSSLIIIEFDISTLQCIFSCICIIAQS